MPDLSLETLHVLLLQTVLIRVILLEWIVDVLVLAGLEQIGHLM